MSGKRQRPITLVVNNADFGQPDALKHAHHVELEQADNQDITTRRVRVEADMVSWYSRRGYITTHQADALRRWQSDAYLAGLTPSCTGSYQPSIAGRQSELSDTRIAAQARRNNAVAFLQGIGKDAVGLVEAVAVGGQSAGRYCMAKWGMSPNEALEALVKFSDQLARHFGLKR